MSIRLALPISRTHQFRPSPLGGLVAFLILAIATATPAFAIDPTPSVDPIPSIDPATFAATPPGQAEVGPVESQVPNLAPPVPPVGAPPLLTTIEGVDFDASIPLLGYIFIPPDPIGAAGPNHVLNIVNTTIQAFDKAGVEQFRNSLVNFFAPVSPRTTCFDPKVIYDQYNHRFIAITLDQTETVFGAPANTSRILVAVSDDSDPNGTWYYTAINSDVVLTSTAFGVALHHWADYPGLAVDDEAIYITANMFNFASEDPGGLNREYFADTRLWIVNKAPLYSGGAASVNVYDASVISGEFTQMPSRMYGPNPAGNGIFLVSAGWSQDFGLGSGAGQEAVSVTRVDNPLGVPSFSQQFVLVGNLEDARVGMPDAQQIGCSLIHPKELPPNLPVDTGDRRAYSVVWRNSHLYAASIVLPAAGADVGQATVHWWDLDTQNLAALTVNDQGNIGGEDIDAGMSTFFPAVDVDICGDLAFGFAASNQTIHPGAFYTGRRPTDPAGAVQPSGVLAAGTDCYRRTFCGSRNRWGDFSGMALDPTDQSTFWVYNEYALNRGTPSACITTSPPDTLREYGRWGTRWGAFQINGPPVAMCKNIVVMGDSTVSCIARYVTPADVDDGSYDTEGDPFTLSLSPPGPYSLGNNAVALIATDACGRADTCAAVITVECPVPVKLASFTVQREARGAVLSWEVAEAADHAGFEVYRQLSGADREMISTGLLSGRTRYEFVDTNPPSTRVDYWLAEISRAGGIEWHGPLTLEAAPAIPAALTMAPGQPNPFTLATTIAYGLPGASTVRLSIFDAQGRKVATLVDEIQGAGPHTATWDGRLDAGGRAAAGFYVVRLEAGTERMVQKLVLTR
jgi:hypothetical protein